MNFVENNVRAEDTGGSCLCGTVGYAVSGEPVQVLNCHCALCRKMNGSAFSTYVVVRAQALRFVRGEADIARHAVTERTTRHFCRTCGTPLFNANPVTYPGLAMLHLGTLDEASLPTPRLNIYCENKLDWVEALGALPGFAGGPADRRARDNENA